MSKEYELGKVVFRQEGPRHIMKLWGIVHPDDIIKELEQAEADPIEKDTILKGWYEIQSFAARGGVMTSSGILVPNGAPDQISVRKGTNIFEIGTDFSQSLGFIKTLGGSVNLNSDRYPIYGIKRGFGKFMHTLYRGSGIIEPYTVDPDAIAQQALLELAVEYGRGNITDQYTVR